jgi:formate dehydrogenase major subunit
MKRLPRLTDWPVLKQIQRSDAHALGDTAASDRSKTLAPRTRAADKIVPSVCPYCAVGCAQLVYVKDNRILDIEGDPDSPISKGALCPKGSATFQLVTSKLRTQEVLHRKPYATKWERIPLKKAMEMVARRVHDTREATWEKKTSKGDVVNRTLGIAHLGGATLDNEENYLIKKLFCSLGILQIENQARI